MDCRQTLLWSVVAELMQCSLNRNGDGLPASDCVIYLIDPDQTLSNLGARRPEWRLQSQ
jgi:hypothetical protein